MPKNKKSPNIILFFPKIQINIIELHDCKNSAHRRFRAVKKKWGQLYLSII